ncbi:unnamed protein product [Mucor hiemalis]
MTAAYDADPSDEQRNKWKNEQTDLSAQLVKMNKLDFDPETLEGLRYIGGVDLSFPLGDNENAVACLIVMSMPNLKIVYKKFLKTKLYLPYISGYLAFREVEPLLQLISQLKEEKPDFCPQVILVDGNGMLHPRQFGIASHLGVLCDIPTIGVAKTFLMIRDELEDVHHVKAICKSKLMKKGDGYHLVGKQNSVVYGVALRTADNAPNPVFISQGHRISLGASVKVVLATCPKYRIPEPVRAADLESRAYIREKQ